MTLEGGIADTEGCKDDDDHMGDREDRERKRGTRKGDM